uniref:Putative transcriptional regulator n=1 Tax=Eubacterium cellulosolvens (strain ATCC 43171 / JCM 9499 / 6) TaxID=633697 RepID=I5AQ53_EUBC6
MPEIRKTKAAFQANKEMAMLKSSILKKKEETKSEIKNSGIKDLDITRIKSNKLNTDFDMDDVAEYAKEIKKVGLLEPLLVYEEHDGSFELVSGHQRLAAVRKLGWKTVPCRMIPYTEDPEKRFFQHFYANKKRKHNSRFWSVEIRNARQVMNSLKLTQTREEEYNQLSDMLGLSVPQIYKIEAVAKLVPELQKLEEENIIATSALSKAVMLSEVQQRRLAKDVRRILDENPEASITRDDFRELVQKIREGNTTDTSEKKTSATVRYTSYGIRLSREESKFVKRLESAKTNDEIADALQHISTLRDQLLEVEQNLRTKLSHEHT